MVRMTLKTKALTWNEREVEQKIENLKMNFCPNIVVLFSLYINQ